ncbi:MAG: flagellar hook protein FlgE [Roseateles sp.]|uniref:flagellar hook protein FlgE n=1 Tax=Roseateles sp. TaxID=1971397 RepID=UPI0039EA8074
MSFQQGLSGLNAASKNLDVIGNNIANSGTYGAKASRAEFADVYAAALNGAGKNQIGIGTSLQAVAQQFTQGNISATENPMDMAVNGAGFFQVTDGVSPVRYTRNGQFKLSRDGFIVNNDNLKLMGYPATDDGIIQPGIAQPIKLPTAGIPPKATTKAALEFTLDSRKEPIVASGIKLTDATTYTNATSMTVYDAKGQDVAVTFYFQKTGADSWNVYATANGEAFDSAGNAVAPDASGNITQPFTTINFPTTGGRPDSIGGVSRGQAWTDSGLTPPSPDQGQWPPGWSIPMSIPAVTTSTGKSTLAIPGIEFDLTQAMENGSNFAVTDLTQDGYSPGQLTGISVADNGTILARYSNGQSKPCGQVELANFRNPQGLEAMGGNVWMRTIASGDAVVGVPGDGNLGDLRSGALEESNVDLTAELVNMVTAQRAYQANAQTIKTQDQVMQTIVNLR